MFSFKASYSRLLFFNKVCLLNNTIKTLIFNTPTLKYQLICIILLQKKKNEKENVLLKFTVTKNGHHLVLSGSAKFDGAS